MADFWPTLSVRDVEATLAFYTQKLDFTSDFSLQDVAGKTVMGDAEFGEALLMFEQSSDPKQLTPPKGLSFTFLLPENRDLDAYYNQLRSKSVLICAEIADRDWGNRDFAVQDPDGYMLIFAKPIR